MVTVDLTTFQINVLFTPDTEWRRPGMFTVDKDIYAIYSNKAPNNEVMLQSYEKKIDQKMKCNS